MATARLSTFLKQLIHGMAAETLHEQTDRQLIELDKQAHIWDVTGITGRQHPVAERSPAELEADWNDLGKDAWAAYVALGRLLSSPGRAVGFPGKQLQSSKPVDAKRIERLITDLDNAQFQVREQAAKELAALADQATAALRQAMAAGPSPEASRRLAELLARLDGGSLSAETIRQIRAVEALDSIANSSAPKRGREPSWCRADRL